MSNKYYAGDTVQRAITIKNESDVLFDPTTLAVIIRDSAGTVQATKAIGDLTHSATGTYKLLYNLASDAKLGTWKIEITATYTVGTLSNREVFLFQVTS